MSTPFRRSWPGQEPFSRWIAAMPAVQFLVLTTGLLMVLAVLAPLDEFEQTADPARAEIARIIRHKCVRSITLSDDGKQAWIVRYPAVLQLVDIASGEVLISREIAPGYKSELHVTAAVANAAVYVSEQGVMLQPIDAFDAPTLLMKVDLNAGVIASSPSNHLVAATCDRNLAIWSAATGTKCQERELECPASRLAWSPDGRHLLVVLGNGRLQIYHGESMELLRSQPSALSGGGFACWSRRGDTIVAFNSSGVCVHWDWKSDRLQYSHSAPSFLVVSALSPDGEWLATPGEEGQVWLKPSLTGAEPILLGSAASRVNALCFTPDGKSLLVGGIDGRLECWSVADGAIKWSVTDDAIVTERSSS